jgi:hypothetical protein
MIPIRRIERLEKLLPDKVSVSSRPGQTAAHVAELRQLLADHGQDFDGIVRAHVAQHGPLQESRDFWLMMKHALLPHPEAYDAVDRWLRRIVQEDSEQTPNALY